MTIKLKNRKSLGRPGITYTDVSKAIEYLIERNEDTTLKNIKIVLKHGSSSVISQHRVAYFLLHPGKGRKSRQYIQGWRDAMTAMRSFTKDNMK